MKNIPPSIYFSGNIENAKLYKSYGLQAYHFLASKAELGGISFLHDKILLPDGTALRITTNYDKINNIRTGNIEIIGVDYVTKGREEEVYMESGFLFHESNLPSAETSSIPSTIRFNEFTTDTSNKLVNASVSRRVTDGDESWAAGCHNKVRELIVESAMGYLYTFTSEIPLYCEGLRDKKLTQTRCPPGIFTGKLRLMVQSIYGSMRSDYTFDEQAPMNESWFMLKGSKIDSGSNTSGLYKDPNDNYWLITMGESITAQKMVPNIKVVGLVKKGDVHKSKSYTGIKTGVQGLDESYILSTLEPKGPEEVIGSQGDTFGYSPLAYGWKFNSDGSEVSIVVINEVPDIPCYNDNTNTSATISGYKTRLITANISFDDFKGKPYLSGCSIIEEGYHLPFQQTKIFTPVFSLDIMQCLTSGPTLSKSFDYIAPIYCFYDHTDVLQIVRVSNGLRYTIGSADTYGGGYAWGPVSVIAPVTDFTDKFWTKVVSAHSHTGSSGVRINGANYTSDQTKDAAVSTTVKWVELDEDRSNPNYSWGYGGIFWDYKVKNTSAGAPCTSFSNYTPSHYKSFFTVIVIPFNDAEAVLIGSEEYSTNSAGTRFAYTFANNVWWKADIYEELPGPYGYTVPGAFREARILTSNTGTMSLSWDYMTNSDKDPGGNGAEDIFGKSLSSNYYRIQVAYIHSSYYPEGIEVYRKEASGYEAQISYNFSLWPLIQTTLVDPFFHNPLSITSSFSGGIQWSMPQDIGGSKDWPTTGNKIFSTPVGWA